MERQEEGRNEKVTYSPRLVTAIAIVSWFLGAGSAGALGYFIGHRSGIEQGAMQENQHMVKMLEGQYSWYEWKYGNDLAQGLEKRPKEDPVNIKLDTQRKVYQHLANEMKWFDRRRFGNAN